MNKYHSIRDGRNDAIDILKCFAAILITNSHMNNLYPSPFTQLATGGAIGDGLFFFASGYTICYSRGGDFFNWYKRRINRIFPTIFAVAALSIILFGDNPTIKDTVVNCGGWFIQCIFLFYAVFWFVKKYLMQKLWVAFMINSIIVIIWYSFFWDYDVFILYNGTYLRWPVYFFSMLLGANIAKREREVEGGKNYSLWLLIMILVALLLFYYGYQLLEYKFMYLRYGQLVLVLALLSTLYCFYKICCTKQLLLFYSQKVPHFIIYSISAMCLEVYLCQRWILPLGMKYVNYFPINVIFSFLSIFIAAYILKVLSKFLSQTFKTEDYNWHEMVKL